MSIYQSLSEIKEYCERRKCNDCEIIDALGICLKAKEWNINTKCCGFCEYYDFSKPSSRYALKVKIEVSIQSLAIYTGGDNLNKFIMLVGLPNTGKTTYAKQYVFGNKDTVIVSYDVLEVKEFGYLKRLTDGKSSVIIDKAKQEIVDNLKKGYSVIYDGRNLTREGRKNIISYVKEDVKDVEIDCVYFKKKFVSSHWLLNESENIEPPCIIEGFDNIERRG